MSATSGLLLGLAAVWSIALAWYFGTLHHTVHCSLRTLMPQASPPRDEGLEELRVAVDEARNDTRPGAPGPDLRACREIWPDAPHGAWKDDSS
ncbi:hypothetical protein ACWGH2_16380 [Streptomyces sp. NPDC054871]